MERLDELGPTANKLFSNRVVDTMLVSGYLYLVEAFEKLSKSKHAAGANGQFEKFRSDLETYHVYVLNYGRALITDIVDHNPKNLQTEEGLRFYRDITNTLVKISHFCETDGIRKIVIDAIRELDAKIGEIGKNPQISWTLATYENCASDQLLCYKGNMESKL